MNEVYNAAAEASEVWIIEFTIAPQHGLLFQSLLQGMEGLAVVRSFAEQPAGQPGRQQLWTTLAQRNELEQWLQHLPDKLQQSFQIHRQYLWPLRDGEK